MRTTLSLLIVILVILFLTSLLVCGCTQETKEIQNTTYGKATVQSVIIFNKPPIEDPNDNDRFFAEKILGPKGEIKKNYKILGEGPIDTKEYLKKHPEDGLMISSSILDARVDVTVYSDNPIPDPEFFE